MTKEERTKTKERKIMKKFRDSYTSSEMGEQLLEMGLPSETADMYYPRSISQFPKFKAYLGKTKNTIPCWSAGRLMDIISTCKKEAYFLRQDEPVYCFLDYAYLTISDMLLFDKLDLSKLEDGE